MGQDDAGAEAYLHRHANNGNVEVPEMGQGRCPTPPPICVKTPKPECPRHPHIVKEEKPCLKNLDLKLCVVEKRQWDLEIAYNGAEAAGPEPEWSCFAKTHFCQKDVVRFQEKEGCGKQSLDVPDKIRYPQGITRGPSITLHAKDADFEVVVDVHSLSLARDEEFYGIPFQLCSKELQLNREVLRCLSGWLYEKQGTVFVAQNEVTLTQLYEFAYTKMLSKLLHPVVRAWTVCLQEKPRKLSVGLCAYVTMHTEPGSGLRLLFLDRMYILVVELKAMVYDFSNNACRDLSGPQKAAANEFDMQFQAHKQKYQNAGISMVWLKPTSAYLDDFPKPTIKPTPKRSQEHSEPAPAQKKRRIGDHAADAIDNDPIGVYLRPEPPATKIVKVMMSRKRLMMVPYAESRLRNSPNVKNIPMARITHAQLATILRCIERSDSHPRHLQEAIRASVYAKRLNHDELFQTISQKVSDWIREGSLSRTQLKECHAAAMEHTDSSETTFPHAAALSSSHQSSGRVYPEVLLQQEKQRQSKVRKWLAQYVIRNGLGKPVTELMAHWQKEGDIPGLELDLRLVRKFYMKERR